MTFEEYLEQTGYRRLLDEADALYDRWLKFKAKPVDILDKRYPAYRKRLDDAGELWNAKQNAAYAEYDRAFEYRENNPELFTQPEDEPDYTPLPLCATPFLRKLN